MNEIIKRIGNAPVARTNMLGVTTPVEQVIEQLMSYENDVGRVCYNIKECNRLANESNENYFRRIDDEIKTYIRQQLGLHDKTVVKYSRGQIQRGKALFFYIGHEQTSADGLITDLTSSQIPIERGAQALLFLIVKLRYLEEAADFYDIQPALFNEEMYIGAFERETKSNGNSVIEALRFDIYYSAFDEVSLSLHREIFDCSLIDTFMAEGDTGAMLFHSKSRSFQVNESLNATKESKRVYMGLTLKSREDEEKKLLSRYDNSINFHQTDVQNKVIQVFEELGVKFEPIHFVADHVCESYVSPEESYQNELVIIDCLTSYSSEDDRNAFQDHLLSDFKASKILSKEDAPSMSEMVSSKANYLVVNQLSRAKGTSIRNLARDKEVTSFSKALANRLSSSGDVFDYYTEAKLTKLLEDLPLVMQGVDVFRTHKNETVKDKVGEKVGTAQVVNKINHNVVKKVLSEIWLKESVLREKKVTCFSLPSANLELFYVRRFRSGRRLKSYVSVVDVTTGDFGIQINKYNRYDDSSAGRFDYAYDFLEPVLMPGYDSVFEGLRDGHFFIHDKDTGYLLNSYHSARVPNVIGNALFDNVERSRSSGISRTNKSEDTPLPYYLTYSQKGTRYRTFIQDCGIEGARYFVTKQQPAQETMDKQSLTRNVLVFDQAGNKVPPLGCSITELFFSSLTFDLLNNSESSKKSILQKVAELYIEN